jgi:hypothetical protein
VRLGRPQMVAAELVARIRAAHVGWRRLVRSRPTAQRRGCPYRPWREQVVPVHRPSSRAVG